MRSCFAVVLCATLLGGTARAEDREVARAEYRQGSQLYDVGEYKQALDSFKAAYRDYQDPTFIFNIAQCYRQLGDIAQAGREYRMYLVKMPDASNRDDVRALISKLEVTLAQEQAAKAAPPPGTASPSGMQPAMPATSNKQPTTADSTLTATAAGPRPRTRLIAKQWWFWTSTAAVVVGVSVGLGVGLTVGQPRETTFQVHNP